MTRTSFLAIVLAALATSASPASAQGKSQQHGHTVPPSRNELATVAPVGAVPTSPESGTPLAWVDDASLLPPGMVSASVSAMWWHNAGVSETDIPIAGAAFGLAPKVQLSATVSHVVGSSDVLGAAGGVGTSAFSSKIAVYESHTRTFKVATSPTILVVPQGVVDAAGQPQSRVQWGLPVSAEISRGTIRLYGGGGYFSPGMWFGGAALGFRAADKTMASVGFSRAWRLTDLPNVPLATRDRKELSVALSRVLASTVIAFGSVGRTIATLDENGAGTAISGGVTILLATAAARP